MITIKNINEHDALSQLEISKHDVIFHGTEVDIRTRSVLDLVTKCCQSKTHHVKYNKSEFSLYIGENKISPRKIEEYFSKNNYSSVFIEATSLDLPEIIYILAGIKMADLKCDITISYVEPDDYVRSSTVSNEVEFGVEEQEFNLSDQQGKFAYLPLFAVNNSHTPKSTLIATLGFESSRLGQLLEQDDGFAYNHIEAYVGIPAYKPGWENRCIYKHMRYLSPNNAELKLFPACNPYEFTKQLKKLTKIKDSSKQIVFAPMGTKPAVIAISIFLVNERFGVDNTVQYAAIYDFPVKAQNRSTGVGKIYSYELRAS
ncbi:hypothetical protein [Vibrio navarrensis]|uniref:hypothetical protein n=1 Tax=Vibrio navarrensis TaxID=29495 RepID=UPI00186AA98B|nr:hypothetical protein [Vibrio navarrensis]MBE4609654.1 hypothetical protein [Vibrio navarrensis]MBE4613343.1 hypothetical protein [Vibrio navarrensis]